ncbi:hypothetical protein BS47DRAFT_1399698 [Hydnum rufescens UP504]|uniref:RING-type domain-containing protein n=1 Tax=Hydnum rufescens UP504 TaxID=1448309 RepID=A0A9P6AIJ4_9AGAM|nr:hypothetical protein BS47DRAFT_1399698 [Hydnum rufescens UP504]
MSTVIDLSRSSPTEDSSRTSLQQHVSPARLVRLNPYASEVISLSDSDESDSDIILQKMQNAGRPKRVHLQSRAEGPVAGPSRSAASGTASSTRHSDTDFSRRDPASSGMENVFLVDVVPYAKGQSFQKPKRHQDDALSRAPSVPPDIIEVSHASVAAVQSQERVLNSDKVAPSPHLDPIDRIVAQVLEIIPDVSPPHALSLAQKYYSDYQSTTHETIVHALLEDPNYPKSERGKRKRAADDEGGQGKGKAKEPKIDYFSKDRPFTGGHAYMSLSMANDYPFIPIPHIRRVLLNSNHLYVPAFYQLRADCAADHPPFKRKAQASHLMKHKGAELYDEAFETERIWLTRRLQEESEEADEKFAAQIEEEELEKSEAEEGRFRVTFTSYRTTWFNALTRICFVKLARGDPLKKLLGTGRLSSFVWTNRVAKSTFINPKLNVIFPPRLMGLWERIKQEKAISQAQIEGLESCPFCSYSVVIENEQERLFRCESEECGIVSCRACKKEDHLPKTCKEMEADKKLDAKHYVEEAMTAALTRRCPKCKHPFIKTEGHFIDSVTRWRAHPATPCPVTSAVRSSPVTIISNQLIPTPVQRAQIHAYYGTPARPERTTRSVNDPACAHLNGSLTDMRNGQVAVAARNALQKYKLEHPDEVSGTLETDFPELLGSSTSRRRAANATRVALPGLPPLQPPPYEIAYHPGAPYNYPPPAAQNYRLAPVLPLGAHGARAPLPRRRRH